MYLHSFYTRCRIRLGSVLSVLSVLAVNLYDFDDSGGSFGGNLAVG